MVSWFEGCNRSSLKNVIQCPDICCTLKLTAQPAFTVPLIPLIQTSKMNIALKTHLKCHFCVSARDNPARHSRSASTRLRFNNSDFALIEVLQIFN